MKRDLVFKGFQSSFLSCEKDCETILEKLLVRSKPYSDQLKRLLVINTKDCLDNTESKVYRDKINSMGIKELRDEGYIRLEPKIKFPEHEEVKSYLLISFNNFMETSNPQFRDCTITFDIMCHTDYWDLGNFRLRPLKIAGYIDSILNNCKLSGIGTLQFAGCQELVLDEVLAGYTLTYVATHGSDDYIPLEE